MAAADDDHALPASPRDEGARARALVSVIVPVYNVEAYLSRCVDSLLRQTYGSIEVILVDDGSPDRCGALCDRYALMDPRVTVVHQENGGLAAARNRGVAIARGKYVTFVDPDDWVDEDLVGHMVETAIHTGADLAVCRFVRTRNESAIAPQGDGLRVLDTREALALYGGPEASLMTSACAKLFPARLLDDIRFPDGRVYEDEFTTWRLVAQADKVAISDEVLYYYFVRPESITQRAQEAQHLLDRVDALSEQAAHLRDVGLASASGVVLRKSFLIQRQVRRRVLSRDPGLAEELRRCTRETARLLRRSDQPLFWRAFATAYAAFPQPFDLAIGASQQVRRARRRSTPGPPVRAPLAREDGRRGLEVVVVAYGLPEMLRSALEPVLSLPVTVVDNSSLPAIRDLCSQLGCRYIDPGRNGGFAAGVNVGLANRESAAADVLLLNPDAIISAGDVARLHAALLAEDDLACVGPRQVDAAGSPIRVAWPFPSPLGTWLDAVGLSRMRPRSEYVSGAILLLRAEAIADVGSFDERYFLYAEEADWQYRARLRGWRHRVVEAVTAVHAGGATSSDEGRRQIHFHASHERFLRTHHGTLGWQAARLGQLTGDLARAAVGASDTRPRLLARARLYARGPMRTERSLGRTERRTNRRGVAIP